MLLFINIIKNGLKKVARKEYTLKIVKKMPFLAKLRYYG